MREVQPVPVQKCGESTRRRWPPVPGDAAGASERSPPGVRPASFPAASIWIHGVLALAVWSSPGPAEGQIVQLLKAVGNGGSWINLPVKEGRASLRSPVLPLAGLSVNGCLHVWERHSGSWTVRARDVIGGRELEARLEPGIPERFDYDAGFRAQLDLEVEWSEPRDTTLFMWVGIERAKKRKKDDERDICQPPPL